MDIVDRRNILIKDEYDVIVVGGGVAGVSAAVAAAREGVKTLLVEKSIVLGGLATIGLISWYAPLCDGNGMKVIGGIAEELIKLSIKYGFDNLPDEWVDSKGSVDSHNRYATLFSPMIFAMALDQYLLENRVKIRLDSLATFPVMDHNHCTGLVVESQEGREYYAAKVVIDATGDASIIYRAGMPTVIGDNYMTYGAHGTNYELACKFVEDRNVLQLRKWFGAGSDMNGSGHPQNLKMYRGSTGDEITEFVLTGRKMLFDKIKNDGKASRDILMLPMMPQLRKIRRLAGEYEFSGKEDEQIFNDSIGSVGDFKIRGRHYHIPYSILRYREFDNLLAAGRIVSATGHGWEIARLIPVVALTGQAAGTAAGISTRSGNSVHDIDILLLRKKLKESGVLFV